MLRTSDQEVRSHRHMFYKMMGVKLQRPELEREGSEGTGPQYSRAGVLEKLQTFIFLFPLKTGVWAFLTEKSEEIQNPNNGGVAAGFVPSFKGPPPRLCSAS